MWYNDLRPNKELIPNKYSLTFFEEKLLMNDGDKKRTLQSLLKLKKGVVDEIPKKEVDRNILLASWNIKEFGHLNERLPESYFYIAEIINAFDIIAIQEIKSSLFDLEKVMRLLGSDWKYLITDITEGNSGNKERFGFIYDTRRVQHSGLSGELVIPNDKNIKENIQLKRTPSITGFECGWKKFSIINLHLQPGNSQKDRIKRKKEVKYLIELLREKKKRNHLWNENLILLGDTNLYENNVDIVDIIKSENFKESEGLIGKPTTTSLTQIYDRIFLNVDRYFKLMKDKNNKEKGGVFNLFNFVFTANDVTKYHKYMRLHKNNPDDLITNNDFTSYFHRYWKRNQISDHLPVWIEIETDSSIDFLESKLKKVL